MANACSLENRPNNTYTDELAEKFAKEVGVDPRPNEVNDELDERGAFVRQANTFITPFGDGENDLKAEADRYAIYWMHGCHWSNRPVIVRDILGLTDVIKDVATTHTGQSNVYGHGFADQKDFKDPILGAYFLSEFYKKAKPDFTGRATTPTLVDTRERTAVNNDYHRLTNYIEVQFRTLQPVDAPDLYPVKYRKEIDEFNDWLFPTVNNGHYRMAFCQSWEAYSEAYEDFYDSIEKLDKRLETNRFLFGDYITDSDIRLYVTLVRWETSYYHNVGPTKKRLTEYPSIWGYVKDLYSLPVFKKYTFFEFPKTDSKEFFVSFAARIASQVPYDELWKTDGSRKKLSNDPENVYKKHPEGETAEDYQSVISVSKWNAKDPAERDSNKRTISQDPAVNPITSKLRD
ncbi:MAG: glutathione S-transferase C-terminal domain-containing protein [Lachnospiraceae bacterium]|nr:glutathione S-transferase C-terminal domain-containing protein [Lachnospiraceae bacterium]